MKAIVACALLVGCLLVASRQVRAAGPFADDVVVVYCEREQMFSGSVLVTHSSSSPGAPTVPVTPPPETSGENVSCAEELAKLTNAKFYIHSVVPADSSYVVYTLLRNSGKGH